MIAPTKGAADCGASWWGSIINKINHLLLSLLLLLLSLLSFIIITIIIAIIITIIITIVITIIITTIITIIIIIISCMLRKQALQFILGNRRWRSECEKGLNSDDSFSTKPSLSFSVASIV
jgi:hypothetical protein